MIYYNKKAIIFIKPELNQLAELYDKNKESYPCHDSTCIACKRSNAEQGQFLRILESMDKKE